MRWVSLALLCVVTAPANSRPLRIDDQLQLQSYGQVQIDPRGRWAVIERRRPYETAPNFQYDYLTRRLLSEVLVVDLNRPGRAKPLFHQASSRGHWIGGFSPSGYKLVIFRLEADKLSAGVIDMASRQVRWFPFSPDLPDASPSPIWVNDTQLLIATFDDRGLPALLETPSRAQRRLTTAWNDAASGKRPSATLLGSGRYRDVSLAPRNRTIRLLDVSTGMERALFTGDVSDFALSADRRRVAIVTRDTIALPEPDEPVDQAFEPRRHRLTIVDLQSGERNWPCRPCDILPNFLAWNPTGQQLLFQTRQDGESWTRARLRRWSGAGGATEPLLPSDLTADHTIQGGNARTVAAAWLGSTPIMLAAGSGQRGWFALQAHRTVRLGARRSEPSRRLGAVTNTQVLMQSGSGWQWLDRDGRVHREIAGEIIEPVRFDPFSLGTRHSTHPRPALPILLRDQRGTYHLLSSPGQRRGRALQIRLGDQVMALAAPAAAITYAETDAGEGSLMLVTPEGRLTLDHINAHLRQVTPPRQVEFTTSANGSRLLHRLTLPDPSAPYPPQLVVIPYPGMNMNGRAGARATDANPMTHAHLLAGHGFAVLEPSIPLPPGPAEPLAGLVEPVITAVDEAQRNGWVSRAPPLLLGHSFGGYAVTGLLARSDRFAAGIAVSGIYDLSAGYGALDPRADPNTAGLSLTMPIGWYESGNGRMGLPPWRDPERYRRNSPFFSVEDIRAPLMLIHGDLDYAPVFQAERMFSAMHRLARDVQLVRYAGEAHVLTSPANIRDYWKRVIAFLDAHSQTPATNQPKPQ